MCINFLIHPIQIPATIVALTWNINILLYVIRLMFDSMFGMDVDLRFLFTRNEWNFRRFRISEQLYTLVSRLVR